MSEPTDDGLTGLPGQKKPRLGLRVTSRTPAGELAPTASTTPPPAFAAPGPAQAPLPTAQIAPTQAPRRRSRPPEAAGPVLTTYHLPPKYRGLAPPGLEGIALANWIFAVQIGEDLARQDVQELAGLSSVQVEILEQFQAVFQLLKNLGLGMVELIEYARAGGLPSQPQAPASGNRPRQPSATGPGDRYDPQSRRKAAPTHQPAPALVEQDDPAPESGERFAGQVGESPPLLNADAERITAYARNLVPIGGIPWPADQQIAIAAEVADTYLGQWSEAGAIPSRWERVIEAELIQRFGIDRAVGDPQ